MHRGTALKYAAIGPIAVHLPERVETIEQLRAEQPKWDLDLIVEKTGIRNRHIAEPHECASDLGVTAAEALFAEHGVDRRSIDFLLFCTQTPDYPLPTTACVMQHRLGLPTSAGALDFNLGCSGYVYGLSLADGLIRSGAARRVLLVTAETYSKYIDPADRSLRTIFGDGAAATLLEAADEPSLGSFVFGTDGSGANMLMVTRSGARPPEDRAAPRRRHRWASELFMDGPALVDFAVESIPRMVEQVLDQAGLRRDQVDLYISHQATYMLLERLRQSLDLTGEQFPLALENYGNTVSSTIPIAMRDLRRESRLRPGKRALLIGFGVGLSWAGCLWRETWSAAATAASQWRRAA